MSLSLKKHHIFMMFFSLCLYAQPSLALEFRPGVGVGVQFTDNAKLEPDNRVSDEIAMTSVAANLSESEGSLLYDASASLRKENYLENSFADQRYLNVNAKAEWEAVRDRLTLFTRDNFYQNPLISLGADTPSNLQDTNEFIVGMDLTYPITGLQQLTITPQYNQYYYEIQKTDNKQYSLAASWRYQMFRLTNIGTKLSARKILYSDQTISDVTFTSLNFLFSGQRVHSSYHIDLGTTTVKRDRATNAVGETNGGEFTGFSGSAKWAETLSSRSTLEAQVLTDLTDTSTVAGSNTPGNYTDVQVSTDVIRNSIANLSYLRNDEQLHTRIWGEYRKLRYSDRTDLNRVINSFGAQLEFPVTQLVSSGVTIDFSSVKQQEIAREDKRFNVAANVNATFTSQLSGRVDVRYRTKESTLSTQNYDEFSLFISLNYGFGGISGRQTNF